jgi:hypothetical protein
MMDCSKVKEWIQRKLDGDEIPPNVIKSFEEHLSACDGCRTWLSEMQTTLTEIRTLEQPKPAALFQARLMRSLGLAPFPLWLRWVTGALLSLGAIWLLLFSFAGEGISSGVDVPLIGKLWRFLTNLFALRSGVTGMLDDYLYLAVIPLGAFVLIVLFGIIAFRKSKISDTYETGNF